MTKQTTDHKLADLTCLYEITKELAAAVDLRSCLGKVMKILSISKGLNNGAVTIINPVTGQIETEVAHGLTAEARKRGTYKIGEGITGRVVAGGASIIVPQISKEPLFLNRTRSRSNGKEILSFLCVPINHNRHTIGAVSVDREYREGLDFEQDLQLGGTRLIKCDVRLITATNKDLEKAVEEGGFREDLYYRLNVFPVYLPPLRQRQTDILLLAEFFLQKYNEENNKIIQRISTPAIDLLMQYHWPGNVRELQNCIERAVLICDEDTIKSYHLPPTLQTAESVDECSPLSFAAAVENFERELIIDSLKKTRGNQTRAAQLLDSSLRIINYKIGKYNITPGKFKTAGT